MRKLMLILAVMLAMATLIPAAFVFGGAEEDRPEHERRVVIFRSGGPRLGVEIDDVTAARAKELGLKEEAGVEVEGVVPDSPAEKAGLKKGDVITQYQGTRVDSAMQLRRLVRETPAGRTVALQVFRDGTSRNVSVKLAEMEDEGHDIVRRHHIEIPPIEIPDIPDIPDIPYPGMMPGHVRLGAQVESLSGQLGEFFGVKGGEGVLVRSVMKGGPGEAAGLRAGDVIVRVDDDPVADQGDLRSALRERRGKDLKLGIVRDKREMTLTVAAPKEGEGEPAQFKWIEGDLDEEAIEDGVEEGVEEALREAHRDLEDGIRAIQKDKGKIVVEARGLAGEMVRKGQALRHRDLVKEMMEAREAIAMSAGAI